MLTSIFHCCFREKELQIFIVLLLSCMLYLRCSVCNLLTDRSKIIKKKYMKEYFQKQRLVLGRMCKNNVENDTILSYQVLYFLPSETLISTNTVF